MDARTIVAPAYRPNLLTVCCRAVSMTIVGLLGVIFMVFIVRGVTGQLRPLDDSSLLVACVGFAFLLVFARFVWIQSTLGRRTKQIDMVVLMLPSIFLLFVALSISRTNSLPGCTFLLTMFLFVAEATWTSIRLRRGLIRTPRKRAAIRANAPADSQPLNPDTSAAPISLAAAASQQISRVQESDGRETVTGLLRGTFSVGQRTQSLHVAFCPPLEATPIVTVAQLEGPTASIKTGQVESFGARFDLRLASNPASQTSIVLAFTATSQQPAEHAA